jgi:hypothetical protein
MKRVLVFFFALLSFQPSTLRAEPPVPETYRVFVRYRIEAFGNDRIVQYLEMMKDLKKLGLQADPRPEGEADDPRATLLSGLVSSKDARSLLLERHVRSLLLADKDDPRLENLKDKPETELRVDFEITPQSSPERQRELAGEIRTRLVPLGFREGFAYDHQSYRRLAGVIPKGKLETLLYDLRTLPEKERISGLAPHQIAIRVIEVMPASMPAFPAPKPPAAPTPPQFAKIAPSLRTLMGNKELSVKATRLEIVLVFDPVSREHPWQTAMRDAAPGLIVEGICGTLVTVRATPDDVLKLAPLPEVALVRLPVAATRSVVIGDPARPEDNQEALKASGLARIHKLKYIGQGVNVAIIDDDFRGWQALVGVKFPRSTHYVDFTAERNSDMLPEPFRDGEGLGHGTRCALVALLAAPGADLTLIRVDPAAPYQLEQAIEYIHGDPVYSFLMEQRRRDLQAAADTLDRRRDSLMKERKDILDDFGQEDETKKRREAYFRKVEDFDRDELAYRAMAHRYLDLATSFRDLRKVRAVVSTLLWNEGHPVDGMSTPSRYFDDRPFRGVLWFQAAGNTRGQTWTGLFRDADSNGVMEFAPLADPTKPEKLWRLELNRLAWQPEKGEVALDIPAKTRVRLTLQWREAHDPRFFHAGEDIYARPLASLRLTVLRQLDPEGKKRPTDDLQLVEQAVGPALRIQNLAGSAVYELPLEFEVAEAGQYFLRIEGVVTSGTLPAEFPTLPSQRKEWELRPRLFVESIGSGGRVILKDYATNESSIAMPADARQVITVGAMDADRKPRAYSATGAPLGLELLRKPDLLTADNFAIEGGDARQGTSFAASFAAGTAASLLSAGLPPEHFFKETKAHPGLPLYLPERWTERPPPPAKR